LINVERSILKIPSYITSSKCLRKLIKYPNEFLALFEHGSLTIEIYVIISGKGTFLNNDTKVNFKAGDFLFVPARIEHRFTNFTPDFSTWVFFYGPKEGE
jgi:cupin superfamily acireductone dioxygenase involved in methionine salvage